MSGSNILYSCLFSDMRLDFLSILLTGLQLIPYVTGRLKHECIHHKIIERNTLLESSLEYNDHPLDPEVRARGRHLAPTYSPIRIKITYLRLEVSVC